MNDIQADHQLNQVIRKANKSVDARVHGPGFVKVFDAKKGSISNKPTMMARMLGNRDFLYYFIKTHGKPVVISEWDFTWREGTSEVELDFYCTFEISVTTEEDAEFLVKSLGGYESPTIVLYRLIDSHLHRVLSNIYMKSVREGNSILSEFSDSQGESSKLNDEVSAGVAADLGSARAPFSFRGGFKLISAPPVQVQFSQASTAFEVSDSDVRCNINTSALFVLENYQKYKASGLKDVKSIQQYMKGALEEATQLYLFGNPYYEVVRNFADTISGDIEGHLEKVAHRIGYQVKMFQSLTDIESMELLDGMRVDVSADETEFRTRQSTGHVKVGLSAEMRVSDFDLLKRLIKPGQNGVKSILKKEVIKICRDVITGIERKAFNLSFDDKVVPQIENALTEKLGKRYGLDVNVIKVEQEPTEDALRFFALMGNTQYFELEVNPIADGGEGDIIKIESAFEIIGMSENGWENFENKDYGYRINSEIWTPSKRAELVSAVNKRIDSPKPEEIEHERRDIAIRDELADIALRIKQVVEARLDKVPKLAVAIREVKHDMDVKKAVEALVVDAIRDEWGLEIKLRAFKRGIGRSEYTAIHKSDNAHKMVRRQADLDLKQHEDVNDVILEGEKEYVKTLMERRKLLLADEDRDPDEMRDELEDIDTKIAEKMSRTESLLDLKESEKVISSKKLDKSWSADKFLLEDSSEEKSK
ncbi:hypothetical protein [Sessilibacter corallicola]|uniref:Band 7 domain-containing protein n=1 Tax=Sessilibacter corallicola TaxID=2904075 RepID=A0ABQ0ADB6_9GAMM